MIVSFPKGTAFGVLVDVDVGLGLAVHKEQANAALDLFDGHVSSSAAVGSGSQIASAHCAGKEEV